MAIGVSKQEPGFILSSAVHITVLLIALLGLADAKKFDDAQEAVPVEVITESQLKQITLGIKTAKQVLPDAKLRVDKVADVKKKDEPPVEKKPEIAMPLPLPPARPVEVSKVEPQKIETIKSEPKEVPLPPKQVAALPSIIMPPARPIEPKKMEPVKKAVTAPAEDQEEKDAEIIRQVLRKKAAEAKQQAEAQRIKEQQEEAAQDAKDAKKLADLKLKQVEAKRLEDAKQEELDRKQEQAEKAQELKKQEQKKLADTKAKEAAEEAADNAKEAKKAQELKKIADAKKAADAQNAKEAAEEAKADKAEADAAAKAKTVADAKKAQATKQAAADAEAKHQADFDKMMRSKLASNAASTGSNGKQTPTEHTASTSGSTGAKLSSAPSSLGAPSATGAKMNPAQREGLQDIIKDQMLKCWSAGSKPSTLPIIKVQLNADGSIAGAPQLVNNSSDPVFQSVAESGMRAIRRCAPYKIPSTYAGFFNDWKNSTIKLDPSDL